MYNFVVESSKIWPQSQLHSCVNIKNTDVATQIAITADLDKFLHICSWKKWY